MTAKIIFLLPHCCNSRLRLINREILDNMVRYPIPSKSECKPPDGSVSHQEKYETLPTTPDS